MKKQLKIDKQKNLFNVIKQTITSKIDLVEIVSELLDISTHSAYRRIRGEKLLDFEEFMILSNHFRIAPSSFMTIPDNNEIQCRYTRMDLLNSNNYINYLHDLEKNIAGVCALKTGEIIFSAEDIPLFYYGQSKELILFRLFSWSYGFYGFSGNFDDFLRDHDFNKILQYYKKIFDLYLIVPSIDIWSDYSIERMITVLNYHYEIENFSDKRCPLIICEQMIEMLETMEIWSNNGGKSDTQTPFKLYVSEIPINNTLLLLKKNEATNCVLKLFTINHFNINDLNFCKEAELWLNNTIRRSILISGASVRERRKFFADKRDKINKIINKIKL